MFGTRKIQASTGAVLGGSALLLLCLLVGLAVGMSACSADSPSEPGQPPGTPPGNQASVWAITVTVNPPQIPAGGDEPVTVTATVRRRDNNQSPPNGTTIVFSASTGSFVSNVGQTVNGRAQVQYLPPATQGSGTVTIQARLEGDVGQVLLTILEAATFHIASVRPNTGSPAGGERVTVQGGGFEAPVRVTFGGVPAQVISVAANRIVVDTPPAATDVPTGSTLPVDVSVIINLNQEGQASDTLASGFVYARGGSVAQPAVFSLSPSGGPNEGGTRVTIRGEGFQTPVQVFFGSGNSPTSFSGVEANVESVTANQIIVTTPSATGLGQNNLNETVDILVRNVGNGFATIAGGAFTYGTRVLVTSISPGEGPFTGGDLVTIFGQGFDEPVAVEMGTVAQSIISVTGTEIVVRTSAIALASCADVSGETRVVNVESGDSATGPVYIYRVPVPVITTVLPNRGPQNGGTTVTINGVNFLAPVRVTFSIGGVEIAGNVSSSTGNQATVTTPGVPNSVFDTEPCDDNGDGTEGERYIATAADVSVANLLTGDPPCSSEFPGGFTFTPSDSSCRNDVGETDPPAPQCSDGLDNDGDGLTDYNGGVTPPGDPECTSDGDDNEAA